MRTWIVRTIISSCLLFAGYFELSYAQEPTLYSTQQETQKHCPHDEVVWLNTNSGIWHVKGARWYGHTKQGAYVCKKEAYISGNRGSLNG
jgi:hypothetical protein